MCTLLSLQCNAWLGAFSLTPVFLYMRYLHNVSLLLSGCSVLKMSIVFFLRLYLNLTYVVLLVASFDYICRSFSEQRKQDCT